MTTTLEPTPTTLTAVPLNHPQLRNIRNWNDRNRVHGAVMAFFPDLGPDHTSNPRAAGSILYRIEHSTQNATRLLLQHTIPINDSHRIDGVQQRDLTAALSTLHPGQPLRFRTVLNAVTQAGRHHSKRTPITDLDQLRHWAQRKLTEAGLIDIHLTTPPTPRKVTAKAPLWTVQFDGYATIANPDTTRTAITTGIGRAKPYGCGLLTIAPAQP